MIPALGITALVAFAVRAFRLLVARSDVGRRWGRAELEDGYFEGWRGEGL